MSKTEAILRFCATLDLGPKGHCSMPLAELKNQACAALAEAATPQAPICRVTMADWGPASIHMYAPGLPAGDHDLYCVPEAVAPCLRDQPT